jgi:hypothetical protein
MNETTQEAVDRFYWSIRRAPCCAGCDWWQYFNSVVGECRRSAPASGEQRVAMIGIDRSSLQPGSGHIMTERDHCCGEFEDNFDWQSLPPAYLRRIGYMKIVGTP